LGAAGGAGKEVLSVVTIGNGKPGPLFQKLYAAYRAAKAACSLSWRKMQVSDALHEALINIGAALNKLMPCLNLPIP
jgi:hypothetical protein